MSSDSQHIGPRPPETRDTTCPVELFGKVENSLSNNKLTLVIAPAGYGKTTLMSACFSQLEEQGQRLIWVPVNALLAGNLSLFDYLYDVLRQSLPVNMAKPRPSRKKQGFHSLLHQLSVLDQQTTIFIDNYHALEDRVQAAQMEQLLELASDKCHFLIATRTPPEFNHLSLLLNDQAVVYDNQDLQLNFDETKSLIEIKCDSPVEHDDIKIIYQRSEGWPLVVQLCCILFNKMGNTHFLKAFSGSDFELAGFLNQQVIDQLPETQKSFLAAAAVLDKFCPELLDFALGNSDSEDDIKEVFHSRLFIYQTDRYSNWYRFHQIFREYLLASQWSPKRPKKKQILQRAAQWSLQHKRFTEAINYALEAGDHEYAINALTNSAKSMIKDNGLAPDMVQWLKKIPNIEASESLELQLWTCWSLTFTFNYTEAIKKLAQLEARLKHEKTSPQSPFDDYKSGISALKILIEVSQENCKRIQTDTGKWLDRYSNNSDPFFTGVVAASRAVASRLENKITQSWLSIEQAKSFVPRSNSQYGIKWVMVVECLNHIEFGNLSTAQSLLEAAYNSDNSEHNPSAMDSTISLLLAKIYYERNDLEQASMHIEQGYSHLLDHGVTESAAFGIEVKYRLLALSNLDLALAELRKLDFLILHYPERLRFLVHKLLFDLLLNSERISEAVTQASLIGVHIEGDKVTIDHSIYSLPILEVSKQIVAISLLIATNNTTEAAARLTRLQTNKTVESAPEKHIELLILSAYLDLNQGSSRQAYRKAAKAIETALSNGYLRLFYERKYFFLPIAKGLATKNFDSSDNKQRKMLKVLNLFGLLELPDPLLEPSDNSSIDTLTKRELEILALLDTGLAAKKIADQLFLSLATVKWHLSNIYSKLDASNKTAALFKARQHKLLK